MTLARRHPIGVASTAKATVGGPAALDVPAGGGAVVVTRTGDRDFWTLSEASDGDGHYVSFFTASDEAGADPVPLAVASRVATRPTAA